jgi:hypothetical protein
MKKANQSQTDTDIENRNYGTPLQRPPRHDLRRTHAPVRDPDTKAEALQKRKDMGGKVYEPKSKSAQSDMQSIRSVGGFEPKAENLQKLVAVETKMDICLKFLSQAMSEFCSLKSIDISPDGKLGGRGFVMEIPEIRDRMYQCVESISCIIDTLYDETRAKHWDCFSKEELPEVQDESQAEQPEDKVAYLLRKAVKNK